MGKYFVDFEPKAKEEIKAHLKSGNKANIKKLEKKGIGCRPFFTSMNLQPVYKKLGYFKNNP